MQIFVGKIVKYKFTSDGEPYHAFGEVISMDSGAFFAPIEVRWSDIGIRQHDLEWINEWCTDPDLEKFNKDVTQLIEE